jgi:hypothetical protein
MKLLCAACLLTALSNAAPAPTWTRIQSAHFEIYSQQGDSANVRASLMWFEQLHAFFAAAGLNLKTADRVRVIGFRSVKDYDAYRLRPTADAYYVGTESREYIVMPSLDPGKFGVAAHEYAHVVLHESGKHLPSWLNEGIAEFFSTVHISNAQCEMGGDIRSHSQLLHSRAWMPLSRLLDTNSEALQNREQSSLFYAQSWAFTRMLLLSPEYRVRLPEMIAALVSGEAGATALAEVYGKSLASMTEDMRAFVSSGMAKPIRAPGIKIESVKATSSELTSFDARSMLAELLLASGELERAQALYDDLSRESPERAEISAALGTIALRKGDSTRARMKWKQAIAQGIRDANLCYRYAIVADQAGLPANEIRPALERAIALKGDFDDARFKLALLESNASNYESELKQLKAMRAIAPSRAFGYWLAMAYAEDQLGQHDESKLSAQQALHFAATPQERRQATELAFVADTELTVQFTRDANGNPQVTTTRVARGTQSWNPFIEPQDRIRRAEGRLRSVECGNDKITGVAIDTPAGPLQLIIADPQHVLVRGATEFTCGPQPAREVRVEYAASENNTNGAGILRGMQIQ